MRAPLTLIPKIDRIDAGGLVEGPGYRVLRPRGTTDVLLVLTLAGEGRFGSPDGDLVVGPGDVVALRPGVPHDYGVTETAFWEIGFSHFHPRPDWWPWLDWPEPVPGVGRIHLTGSPLNRVRSQLRAAGRYSRSGLPQATAFAFNAMENALLWCDAQNPAAGRLDGRIVDALEFLEANLTRPLSVADLAAAGHLSPSRFAHLFRAQLGVTPAAYLEQQRIALARQLLTSTDRPVSTIAAQVGFADPLYFSARFRRLTGDSPTAYRRSRPR